VGETANEDDTSREAVNEDASVNRMEKDVSRGEAEVAKTKTTEVSETAAKVSETNAEVSKSATAVTTPHRRCLGGVRKTDTRKSSRARLDLKERQNGERQRRQSKPMLAHRALPCVATIPACAQRVGATGKRRIRIE